MPATEGGRGVRGRKKTLQMPAFKNESAEADWWASPAGRAYVKQKSAEARAEGAKTGGSSLRTPDLAQGFWAAEENDLTRIYRSGWLLRAALKEKLGPCRSFSCRSFRRA